jgi:hypothetical protein
LIQFFCEALNINAPRQVDGLDGLLLIAPLAASRLRLMFLFLYSIPCGTQLGPIASEGRGVRARGGGPALPSSMPFCRPRKTLRAVLAVPSVSLPDLQTETEGELAASCVWTARFPVAPGWGDMKEGGSISVPRPPFFTARRQAPKQHQFNKQHIRSELSKYHDTLNIFC